MKEKYKNLPLRNGVGIVVLNNENKVFVAKRIDNPKNFWQMPQGGIDNGENYYEGSDKIIKSIPWRLKNITPEESLKNVIKEITNFLEED